MDGGDDGDGLFGLMDVLSDDEEVRDLKEKDRELQKDLTAKTLSLQEAQRGGNCVVLVPLVRRQYCTVYIFRAGNCQGALQR